MKADAAIRAVVVGRGGEAGGLRAAV
ncbi:MAG: hypothetical protein QOE44_2470, partial [Solirubrobacteraceae bacterium]|nr:hypothetical protein [Solirubrobacteraceae bacterium]